MTGCQDKPIRGDNDPRTASVEHLYNDRAFYEARFNGLDLALDGEKAVSGADFREGRCCHDGGKEGSKCICRDRRRPGSRAIWHNIGHYGISLKKPYKCLAG